MYPRCQQFGFDKKKIQQRLAFIKLTNSDLKLAQRLNTEVIKPNINSIIDRFYDSLLFHSDSRAWLLDGDVIQKLKKTQGEYLLSLGINFDTEEYFESRLEVGVIHAAISLPLSIYQGAYSKLIHYIIEVFPDSLKENAQDCLLLVDFLVRITSLDISLATEAYHHSHVNVLEHEIKLSHGRENEYRTLSESDPLTSLYNRKHTFYLLNKEVNKTRLSSSGLCVMMIDIDHFKNINDSYGHQVGDEVIKQVALTIKKFLRSQDIAGRYGGEEFIVGMGSVNKDIAVKAAERIRIGLSEIPIVYNGHTINITASIGAAFLNDNEDLKMLVRRADTALYSAKDAGRNCIIFSEDF